MIYKAKIELCRKLAYRVKDIISLEEIPKDVSANLFLEAVYLAYHTKSGCQNQPIMKKNNIDKIYA